MSLSKDSQKRKDTPIFRGFMAYFPDAVALVAQLSAFANEKHNPGEHLHWSKGKSNDHMDCAARHSLEVGTWDADNDCDHAVAYAWRAMANLQTMIEDFSLTRGPNVETVGTVPTLTPLPADTFDELRSKLRNLGMDDADIDKYTRSIT